MKNFILALSLMAILSSGCVMTKLLIPGGEPLTVEETEQLDTIKDIVGTVAITTGWLASHVGTVLIPGGAGAAILSLLGTYLYRRRKKTDGGALETKS
jgi:hypothetical protein